MTKRKETVKPSCKVKPISAELDIYHDTVCSKRTGKTHDLLIDTISEGSYKSTSFVSGLKTEHPLIWLQAFESFLNPAIFTYAWFNHKDDSDKVFESQIHFYKNNNKVFVVHIFLTTGVLLVRGKGHKEWLDSNFCEIKECYKNLLILYKSDLVPNMDITYNINNSDNDGKILPSQPISVPDCVACSSPNFLNTTANSTKSTAILDQVNPGILSNISSNFSPFDTSASITELHTITANTTGNTDIDFCTTGNSTNLTAVVDHVNPKKISKTHPVSSIVHTSVSENESHSITAITTSNADIPFSTVTNVLSVSHTNELCSSDETPSLEFVANSNIFSDSVFDSTIDEWQNFHLFLSLQISAPIDTYNSTPTSPVTVSYSSVNDNTLNPKFVSVDGQVRLAAGRTCVRQFV